MRNYKYYFARLNLVANYDDKKDFLFTALRTKKTLSYYDYLWGFLDVHSVKNDGDDFFYGYLAKAQPLKDEEVANFQEQEIDTEQISNSIVAKSLFFIHVKSGVIAFHPVGNSISRNSFRGRFEDLFSRAFDDFFVNASVQSISENYKLKDVITKFRSIFEVNIKLHPSNPSFRDKWERYDERMKNLNVGSYTEVYRSDSEDEGINAIGDEEIEGKITMAEDGYGEAKATGDLNGETKTVSTSENPIWEKAPSDKEMPVETILKRLIGKFKEIFSRFGNNEDH